MSTFASRRITVEGLENLPKGQPFILAPNHQNALMDAIAVLYSKPGRTVFLARSDIFRHPTVAAVLRFLKIMPVYRIRDGHDELSKNEEIFAKSVEVLQAGVALCLMPEGRQSFRRILFPLVKGMFRIAFRAQAHLPDKELSIIPVGIDYEDYIQEGKHLIIRYGKPIHVKPHLGTYRENPARGLRNLQSEVAQGIDHLVQNIRSADYYDTFYNLSQLFCNEPPALSTTNKSPVAALEARQRLSKALELELIRNQASIDTIVRYWYNYRTQLIACRQSDQALAQNRSSYQLIVPAILLLLTTPLALYAWLVNALPTYLPRLITRRFKDKSFSSSFNYVLYLLILLLISITGLIVLYFSSIPWWQSIPLVVTVSLLRQVVFQYSHYLKEVFLAGKWIVLKIAHTTTASQLLEQRNELKSKVSALLE